MLTRQQKRQANRRLKSNRFPFPEHHRWLDRYLKENPEFFAQIGIAPNEIMSNLSGEVKTYDAEGFYELILKLKSEEDSDKQKGEKDV